MTTQKRRDSFLKTVEKQSIQIDFQLKKVDKLELEIAVYKKNSNNTHIAPSTDENRVKTTPIARICTKFLIKDSADLQS